jgi:hypothetical protein
LITPTALLGFSLTDSWALITSCLVQTISLAIPHGKLSNRAPTGADLFYPVLSRNLF